MPVEKDIGTGQYQHPDQVNGRIRIRHSDLHITFSYLHKNGQMCAASSLIKRGMKETYCVPRSAVSMTM